MALSALSYIDLTVIAFINNFDFEDLHLNRVSARCTKVACMQFCDFAD